MSSSVTTPMNPPYSSTTIAMWIRFFCMSRSRSPIGFIHGLNTAGRMTSGRTIRSGFCSSGIRSRACSTPTM